jgi:hypothetical protein
LQFAASRAVPCGTPRPAGWGYAVAKPVDMVLRDLDPIIASVAIESVQRPLLYIVDLCSVQLHSM